MPDAFIFSGQSNMSAYTPMGTLKGSGLVSNPAAPGSAPNYVPGYQQTDTNEWTGSPPASEGGTVYEYPTDANAPCLYNENVSGDAARTYDAWGAHVKQFPQFSLSGGLGDGGMYGLELSFLASHYAARPTVPLAAVKCSLGGTSIASDWLPANTGSNAGAAKNMWVVMEEMVTEAAARLNVSAPGEWRWAGFVWMQGESGAHTYQGFTSDATYLSDARAFFAAVRTLTGRADLPVIVGRIGDNWLETNPYLIAAGNGYTSIDYSITSVGATVNGTTRANALAGANARRTTQQTLGTDANCTWWDNDGYPVRPPLSLTAAPNDSTGYHWGGPGNLTAGERAYAAYNAAFGGHRRLRLRAGGNRLRLAVN